MYLLMSSIAFWCNRKIAEFKHSHLYVPSLVVVSRRGFLRNPPRLSSFPSHKTFLTDIITDFHFSRRTPSPPLFSPSALHPLLRSSSTRLFRSGVCPLGNATNFLRMTLAVLFERFFMKEFAAFAQNATRSSQHATPSEHSAHSPSSTVAFYSQFANTTGLVGGNPPGGVIPPLLQTASSVSKTSAHKLGRTSAVSIFYFMFG